MGTNEHWTDARLSDLSGDVVVITGANSGIGFEATRMLAAKGAHIVMACRNEQKAEAAMADIKQSTPEASLEFMQLDLADLSSVRSFAEQLANTHKKVDRLINNAGLMALPYRETVDGFEMQFGVNHLGHFALTNLVLPLLSASENARVVVLSSNAHTFGNINFDNLHGEQKYSTWGAYGQSKLANLIFGYELQRQLEQVPADIKALVCHPGYAATKLQEKGPQMSGSSFMERLVGLGNQLIAQDAYHGALPTVRAAYDESLEGGVYVGPGGFGNMRGYPVIHDSSKRSYNKEVWQQLWDVSEELTQTSFPLS